MSDSWRKTTTWPTTTPNAIRSAPRCHGEKLTGAFSLVGTDLRGRQEQWLLIKKDDEGADTRREPAKTQPESLLCGKTNEELVRP